VFPPAGSTAYQPLLYAVSGVRADDRPLLNSRPGGRARMVAPAAQALAEDLAAQGPTSVITGTSAATAVTSAIAATLWGYRPRLSGPEIMDIIRGSGTRLGEPADFCLGGRPCTRGPLETEVVRSNLCQAVRQACAAGLESCPGPNALPQCTPRPAHAGPLPALTTAEMATITGAATRTYRATDITYSLYPLEVCGWTALWTTSAAYPDSPCPQRQYYGTPIRPWTGPQPSSNPCPVCTIEQQAAGSWSVTMSIDDEFGTTSLSSPVLRVYDSAGAGYDIDLSGVGTLSGGDVAVVDDVDLSSVTGTVESAEIMFRMEDGSVRYSSESELMVQP